MGFATDGVDGVGGRVQLSSETARRQNATGNMTMIADRVLLARNWYTYRDDPEVGKKKNSSKWLFRSMAVIIRVEVSST